MTRKHARLLVFSTILLGLLFTQKIAASGAPMNVTLGYGGYVLPEHWNPLLIEFNGVMDNTRVEITTRDKDNAYHIIENFTVQNHNRLELPIFASENVKSVKVRLFARANLVSEEILDMQTRTFPGQLVLTVDLPASSQQAIEKSLLSIEPVLVVPLDIHDLPGLVLNYDGVSGLVINNFKSLLNPAQLKALRGWLTGGGRMAVFGTEHDLDMILDYFDTKQYSLSKELSQLKVGLGNLSIFRSESYEPKWSSDSQKWREILSLKPFREKNRLTTAYCLSGEPSGVTAPFPFVQIAIILLIWVITAGALFIFCQKNLIVYFLIFVTISSILTLPIASHLMPEWRRGSSIGARAIILPDNGGMILETYIEMKKPVSINIQDIIRGSSPWGVDFTWKNDEWGSIIPYNNTIIWNHRSYPFFSVHPGKSATLDLTGWLYDVSMDIDLSSATRKPAKLDQNLIPATAQTVSWDGKQWRLLRIGNNGTRQWMNITSPPKWLGAERDWLKKLQSISPDTVWLGGYSILPSNLRPKIQNAELTKVFWATPYL